MTKLPDFTGRTFSKLKVLEHAGSDKKAGILYLCECECGKKTIVCASDLKSGNIKSCGCLHGEVHGCSDDRLYSVWQTMKRRCDNPNNSKYKNYGGRGIRVCSEWYKSFSAFREWALANGYDYDSPYGKCTLDRIDVNGNYEPSNCRWADAKTQANNKRDIKYEPSGIEVDYDGRHYKSLSALARAYGFHSGRLMRRIHRMTIEEAMSEIMASIYKERNQVAHVGGRL